jgi:hypothetical protein
MGDGKAAGCRGVSVSPSNEHTADGSGENALSVERIFELGNKAYFLLLASNSAENGDGSNQCFNKELGRRALFSDYPTMGEQTRPWT